MIRIQIKKNKDEILGFECEGHSGYDEFGKDIVCSAVSSIVGACHLGLKKVVNAKFVHFQDDERGYFKLELLENSKDAQVLLKTLEMSLKDLAQEYPKFVSIKLIGGC